MSVIDIGSVTGIFMSSTTYTADAPRTSTLLPMMIIGVLFFTMGFFTWLNGPLISFVKVAFTLDDINAFLVPFAFYVSYFVLALPAGAVLKRTGMKKGMVLGLFIMALGAALSANSCAFAFIPAH